MKYKEFKVKVACLIGFLAIAADPGNVPQQTWPGFLGAGATPVEANSLPLFWSPKNNIAWSTAIPGAGQSSPILWGDRIYVTSVEGQMKDWCHVIALSLKDGAILWDTKFPSSQKVRSNRTQSRAAPTPLADKDGVYAFFETGELVALDHLGKTRWNLSLTRKFGNFESNIGLAASPVQTRDSVVVLLDHEGPSCLVSFSKKDGSQIWKTERDSRSSYSSPALIPFPGGDQIVCSSSGSVDGYDPLTGKQLWSFDDVGGNNVATPFPVGGGRFLVGAQAGMHNEREKEAKKSNFLMSVSPGADGKPNPAIEWRSPLLSSFSNPTAHNGIVYWVTKVGVVGAFDSKTGSEFYSQRLKDPSWAAPMGFGDRVYFFGKDGLTTVVQAGSQFKVLAENRLWDASLSLPSRPAREPAEGSKPEEKKEEKPARGPAETGKPEAKKTLEKKEEKHEHPKDAPKEAPNGAARRGASRDASAAGGPIFTDPVQYGVAVTNGAFIVRTGSKVWCIRQPK